ncbi:MAG: efflux RND transporter periplasmic adaptor subunit [Tannerellaceae bacterium]
MNVRFIPVLLLTGVLVSCGGNKEVKELPLRPVKVEKVMPLNVVTKSFSGVVAPDQFSDLAFRMSGPLVSLNVDEGQTVKRGQIIAEIDPNDFKLTNEADYSNYQTAKSQLERAKNLLAKQAISVQEYETTEAKYSSAKANYEYSSSVLSDTKLRAPFDGFIAKKYVENYQKVQAGQGIVSLINPSKLLVNFTLPETNAPALQGEYKIYVEFESYKGKLFSAKIRDFVEASPDGAGLPVTLLIDDPAFKIDLFKVSVGYSCTILLETINSNYTNVYSVPLSAIFSDPKTNQKCVFVYNSQTESVEQRAIETAGLFDADRVVIASGLKENDSVVTAGVFSIIDGQKVKLLTE